MRVLRPTQDVARYVVGQTSERRKKRYVVVRDHELNPSRVNKHPLEIARTGLLERSVDGGRSHLMKIRTVFNIEGQAQRQRDCREVDWHCPLDCTVHQPIQSRVELRSQPRKYLRMDEVPGSSGPEFTFNAHFALPDHQIVTIIINMVPLCPPHRAAPTVRAFALASRSTGLGYRRYNPCNWRS